MQTGVALLGLGSAPYLEGSAKNFLSGVDLATGMVKGCLTPTGASPAIYHAKPVIIQAAWIAAKHSAAGPAGFAEFLPQMLALDRYWETTARDPATGLYRWHDQLESGCDNLVLSQCPSTYGTGPPHPAPCWEPGMAYTLASTDLAVFLYREKLALLKFLIHFGNTTAAAAIQVSIDALRAAVEAELWSPDLQRYIAVNTSQPASSATRQIIARTHLLAFPLFAGRDFVDVSRAHMLWHNLADPEMLSPFGVRSAASTDPKYTNADYVTPYSNWRGPVWINTNVMLAYGLAGAGLKNEALEIATRVVATLANAIRANPTLAAEGKAWKECYSSETGVGLAAPGFLNWNTLAGPLSANIEAGIDPFQL